MASDGGQKSKANARQSMKNKKYYEAQFLRTEKNKKRKALRERKRMEKAIAKREKRLVWKLSTLSWQQDKWDIAEKTSHAADNEGITGFMYGCAVSILAHCWKHGEELRKWHNGEYKYDGDGVVNPAILTIKA